MEIIDTYKTIKAQSEGTYKEKGSKFIGYAVACYDEEEAKSYLNEWRKAHHQARHLCYAYRFGLNKDVYRVNDDGEPSNSAGAPILGQIQSADLTNVLIGVIRYFGGTKLGVGGLVQAYKTAAKDAIQAGEIIEKKVWKHFQLQFDYETMPNLMFFLKSKQIEIEKQIFESDCILKIGIELEQEQEIIAQIENLNTVQITELGIY
ncbi:MAG: YigZ family protein [Crocinitomicaceae bacterium]|nr:YigZ family protein [Crocinitomicaceae bacterium]